MFKFFTVAEFNIVAIGVPNKSLKQLANGHQEDLLAYKTDYSTWSTRPVSLSPGLGTDKFFLYFTPNWFSRLRRAGMSVIVIEIWLTIKSRSLWTAGFPLIKWRSILPKVSQAPCLKTIYFWLLDYLENMNVGSLTDQNLAGSPVSFQWCRCKKQVIAQHYPQRWQHDSLLSRGLQRLVPLQPPFLNWYWQFQLKLCFILVWGHLWRPHVSDLNLGWSFVSSFLNSLIKWIHRLIRIATLLPITFIDSYYYHWYLVLYTF